MAVACGKAWDSAGTFAADAHAAKLAALKSRVPTTEARVVLIFKAPEEDSDPLIKPRSNLKRF
jgi:hypothetical protein